ncbi:major facilitator superfamily domain-containing protein [Podospora appendiculata]|uniref:Major facilitator superfamily domain-containing protein n=1 Tax=Podospora appendiculata TaxID=314037 RepID=A0AAE1C818_9PEZI|nr:major facilitator superfamily domain-containing protein [Podospora appendiculata]
MTKSVRSTLPSATHDRLSVEALPVEAENMKMATIPRSSDSDMTSTNPADEGAAGANEPQYLTGVKFWTIMASVTAVAFLMMLDTSIISTARPKVPRITDEFHSLEDVGWYASAYQLASAALQPLTGKIYTKFSLKWSFLGFFALFEIGSLICGAAVSSTMLIVGRAIAGMGASGLMNGGLTIIASAVPLDKRPSVTGSMMGISQLGIVCGPLVGGALTSYATWRWCFYLNLPFGAIVAVGLFLVHIPDQIKKQSPISVLRNLHHELDLIGFVLFAPAAIQLLLALQYGGSDYAWNSATVIGLFCGAGATFVVWLVWNWHCGEGALIPLSTVKKRVVWSTSLTQWLLMSTLYCSTYFVPIYFQAVKDATPILSGVYMLSSIVSQLLFAISSGVLVERTGFAIPYAVFAGILAAVSSGLMATWSPTTPTGEWVGYLILGGSGRGAGMQMPTLALQATLRQAEIAVAIALLMFFQMLGAAVMLVISNIIFMETLRSQLVTLVPNANVDDIIKAGATGFRNIISAKDLPGVLLAFANSIDRVFWLVAALGGLSVFTALFMGWVDIRKKKAPATGSEQA